MTDNSGSFQNNNDFDKKYLLHFILGNYLLKMTKFEFLFGKDDIIFIALINAIFQNMYIHGTEPVLSLKEKSLEIRLLFLQQKTKKITYIFGFILYLFHIQYIYLYQFE